jgi:ABC-type transport system involved in multi-copper enzyme maturation permease subunit
MRNSAALFAAWSARAAGDLRAFIRALSPGTLAWAIPGPIFHKEMRVAGRRGMTYLIRCLYTLALIALVALVYVAARESTDDQGGAAALQRVQGVAPAVAIAVAWFQMVGLPIVAIILASPQICDEKRAGTLASLLTTPLRAWQVVLGKFAVVSVQISILALTATPVLLAVRLFGGVSPEFIFAMELLTITTALLATALSLLHSTATKGASGAAAGALVATSAAQAWLPLILAIGVLRNWNVPPDSFGWACSPAALMMLCVDMLEPFANPFDASRVWPIACVYNLAVGAIACLGAASRVRAVIWRRDTPGSSVSGHDQEPEAAHARRTRKKSIVGDNPVLWRESRQPTFRSPLHAWLVSLSIAAGLGLLYWQMGLENLHEPGVHFSIAFAGSVISIILAIFTSAGEISGEREGRTLEVLLTTPLSARAIVWGKFLGYLHRSWFVPTAVMAHFVIMVVMGQVHPGVLLALPVMYLFPLAAVAATGIMFSTLIERTPRAAAANFTLWFALYAVLPVVGALTVFGLHGGAEEEVLGVLLFPNAPAMTIVTMTGLVRDWGGSRWSDTFDYFGITDLGGVEFALLLTAWAGLYAGAAWGALSLGAARIKALTARLA